MQFLPNDLNQIPFQKEISNPDNKNSTFKPFHSNISMQTLENIFT